MSAKLHKSDLHNIGACPEELPVELTHCLWVFNSRLRSPWASLEIQY